VAAKSNGTSLKIALPKSLFRAAKARPAPFRSDEKDAMIPNREIALDFVNDIQKIRNLRDRTTLLRFLAVQEGPLSTALHNIVQVANNGYKIAAYDVGANTFSAEGTNLAMGVMARFDTLYDFSGGFSGKMTTETLLETMLREAVLTNGVAAELVLNAAFQPDSMNVIPLETIRWRNSGKNNGVYPTQIQYNQRAPVDLDIPTFFVQRMAADPGSLYPRSMLDSAVKLLVYFEEFMDDVRRVVRQSGHARQVITLDTEKAIKTAPSAVKSDPKKLSEWLTTLQTAVQTTIDSIEPEDALILYDTGRERARFVSIADIMDPGFDPTPIRGQIVFIGASAEALGDLKTTPLEPLMPGVDYTFWESIPTPAVFILIHDGERWLVGGDT